MKIVRSSVQYRLSACSHKNLERMSSIVLADNLEMETGFIYLTQLTSLAHEISSTSRHAVGGRTTLKFLFKEMRFAKKKKTARLSSLSTATMSAPRYPIPSIHKRIKIHAHYPFGLAVVCLCPMHNDTMCNNFRRSRNAVRLRCQYHLQQCPSSIHTA